MSAKENIKWSSSGVLIFKRGKSCLWCRLVNVLSIPGGFQDRVTEQLAVRAERTTGAAWAAVPQNN